MGTYTVENNDVVDNSDRVHELVRWRLHVFSHRPEAALLSGSGYIRDILCFYALYVLKDVIAGNDAEKSKNRCARRSAPCDHQSDRR